MILAFSLRRESSREFVSPRNHYPLAAKSSQPKPDWLEHTFLPGLSRRLGKTQASFCDLKTCLSELFNNIREHTRLEIGSIFVQHYPKRNRITVRWRIWAGHTCEGPGGAARAC